MKGTLNKFTIKNGVSPYYIGAPLHIRAGSPCILVFDNDTCVGIVWEHRENRYSLANGQAEIRFFERYRNRYNLWHRMFVNEQRLSYRRLQTELNKLSEYIYLGNIKDK